MGFPLMSQGQTILHYEFLERIGKGGMGEVYKARDTRLNRFLAIKVLLPGKSGDPERRRRFTQEAQTASALSHPNIITIHDIFHEGDTHYIVMEYVSGRTLMELIPPCGLRVPQVLQYATQMADALSAAHAAGIIHRDLKPANVMVTATGLVKILDFGLAKLTDPSAMMNMTAAAGATVGGVPTQFGEQVTLTNVPLTMEGSILGTVNYMSPEQAEGKRVDARSDIFSFGAVLYEMVTGRRAFKGHSDISTLSAVLRDEATPISDLVPDVPHELEDLVRICMRKDPNARWQSMKEVEMGLSGLKRRSDAGVLHPRQAAPVSDVTVRVSAPAIASAPVAAPASLGAPTVRKATRIPRNVFILGGAGLVLLLAVATGWWWMSHRGKMAGPVARVAAPVGATAESNPPVPVPPVQPQVLSPVEAAPGNVVPGPAPGPGPAPRPGAAPATRATSPAAVNPTAQPVVPPAVREIPKPKVEANGAPAETMVVSVSDGSPFRIALADDVPADAPGGQQVAFRALDDLKVGDTVVIARGAAVTGSIVSEAGKKKFLAFGGKMTFRLASAEAVDGQKLSVRAAPSRRSDGPTSRPIDTGKYAKPKELAAARGTDYVAYIDGGQTVTAHK